MEIENTNLDMEQSADQYDAFLEGWGDDVAPVTESEADQPAEEQRSRMLPLIKQQNQQCHRREAQLQIDQQYIGSYVHAAKADRSYDDDPGAHARS